MKNWHSRMRTFGAHLRTKVMAIEIKVLKWQMVSRLGLHSIALQIGHFAITIVGVIFIATLQLSAVRHAVGGFTGLREFFLAIGGMIGTMLALVFSLSIIPVQRAVETFTPSITKLYRDDRTTQVIFIVLGVFCLISFVMAVGGVTPLPAHRLVQLGIIIIAMTLDALRLHHRHMAQLLQPAEAIRRLSIKAKKYIVWLQAACSRLARIQWRSLSPEQRKETQLTLMESGIYGASTGLHQPLKIWVAELAETAHKAVSRGETHTAQLAIDGLVELARTYIDSRKMNLRLFPSPDAFLAVENDLDILLSPVHEHLKDIHRSAAMLKAETTCIHVIRGFEAIATHTVRLRSPVFPSHEAPLTFAPMFYLIECISLAQRSGLDDAVLQGSDALLKICKNAANNVDITDVHIPAFEGWESIARNFLMALGKGPFASRAAGNIMDLLHHLQQRNHHDLKGAVQDGLERIERLVPLATAYEQTFGSPVFGRPLENVYGLEKPYAIGYLVQKATSLIREEKADGEERPWINPYGNFIELNEVIHRHFRNLAEKVEFGSSFLLWDITQTLKHIAGVYLSLLRAPVTGDPQHIRAVVSQLGWYEAFFWVVFSKDKTVDHRRAEEACDVLAWIGMALYDAGQGELAEQSANNVASVLDSYCQNCTTPNPYYVADLLMNIWYIRLLAESRGDSSFTKKLDEKMWKPKSLNDQLWPAVNEALDTRKGQLQHTLEKYERHILDDAVGLLKSLLKKSPRSAAEAPGVVG